MRTYDEIVSNPNIWGVSEFMGMHTGMLKLPECGTCTVVWSDNEDGYEHASVSPKHRSRIPSWNDMTALKDTFWTEQEEAYQIMPKKSEYVNLVNNCLHLWKPIGHELHELVEMEER